MSRFRKVVGREIAHVTMLDGRKQPEWDIQTDYLECGHDKFIGAPDGSPNRRLCNQCAGLPESGEET